MTNIHLYGHFDFHRIAQSLGGFPLYYQHRLCHLLQSWLPHWPQPSPGAGGWRLLRWSKACCSLLSCSDGAHCSLCWNQRAFTPTSAENQVRRGTNECTQCYRIKQKLIKTCTMHYGCQIITWTSKRSLIYIQSILTALFSLFPHSDFNNKCLNTILECSYLKSWPTNPALFGGKRLQRLIDVIIASLHKWM